MKKIILLFLLSPLFIFSQKTESLSFQIVKIVNEQKTESKSTDSDKEVHLIVKGNKKAIEQFIGDNNGAIKYNYGNIFAIRIPVSSIQNLMYLNGLEKAEIHNKPLYFNDEKAIKFTSTDTVHAGLGLLSSSYTGKDVIVGIIDSGIDPKHIDFKNDDGSTRILAFWDQLDTVSSLPPYGYGKEYTKLDIDNGEMSNYVDSTFNGHGSAVTGMAAGGGKAHAKVKGMAPEADIIVVGINPNKLDYLNWTPALLAIVDGIDYIFKKADDLGKPAVINISLGGIEGSHDGKDLPTRLIEEMLDEKNGRALVASAGNSGTKKLHIGMEAANDTVFTWFRGMYSNSEVCQRDSGAYMSFYGDSMDVINLSYNIGAENRTPCCSVLDETGFQPFLQPLGQFFTDTLYDGTEMLGVVTTYVEKIEDTYGFFMEIKSNKMNLLWRFSLAGEGKIDGWAGPTSARSCNSEYIENPLIIGTPLQIEGFDTYVKPDKNQTIGTAYTCSGKVITVGAYSVNEKMLDVDSITRTYFVGAKVRANFSSVGPTRDGRIKPEISGPGSRVITTQASHVLSNLLANSRSTVFVSGKHSITDGTSFSSPAVAGIVALYFEKYPNASYANVKYAMTTTADQDALTGAVMPNNENGFGRINAYRMLLDNGINSTNEFVLDRDVLIYPNPSRGEFFVQFPDDVQGIMSIEVYSLSGSLILETKSSSNPLTVQLVNSGFYILRLTNEDGFTVNSKIIVE